MWATRCCGLEAGTRAYFDTTRVSEDSGYLVGYVMSRAPHQETALTGRLYDWSVYRLYIDFTSPRFKAVYWEGYTAEWRRVVTIVPRWHGAIRASGSRALRDRVSPLEALRSAGQRRRHRGVPHTRVAPHPPLNAQ
jgi:hypothetical protein